MHIINGLIQQLGIVEIPSLLISLSDQETPNFILTVNRTSVLILIPPNTFGQGQVIVGIIYASLNLQLRALASFRVNAVTKFPKSIFQLIDWVLLSVKTWG